MTTTEREFQAAARVAASTETVAVPEVAQRSWAYYEGVEAKHLFTQLRHAYMAGFLAAEAAHAARIEAEKDANAD